MGVLSVTEMKYISQIIQKHLFHHSVELHKVSCLGHFKLGGFVWRITAMHWSLQVHSVHKHRILCIKCGTFLDTLT